MLLDCPACTASYVISHAEIGHAGRTVICPRCDARWHVAGSSDVPLLPHSDDITAEVVSSRPRHSAWSHAPRSGLLSRLRAPAAVVACLVVTTALIGAREHVVRLIPRTAALYARAGMPVNVRGLAFAEVRPSRPDAYGPDIVVSGEIRNVAARRVRVPRLAYVVRDAAGGTLVSWSEAVLSRTLAAGHSLAFASAPHTVPPESRSVLVRFESDADAPAAVHVARALIGTPPISR